MKYIINRNNKITDFKIGDIVVYNPYIDNLPEPKDRPNDIGVIYRITNTHIYMQRKTYHSLGGICVESIDHYPSKNKIIIKI